VCFWALDQDVSRRSAPLFTFWRILERENLVVFSVRVIVVERMAKHFLSAVILYRSLDTIHDCEERILFHEAFVLFLQGFGLAGVVFSVDRTFFFFSKCGGVEEDKEEGVREQGFRKEDHSDDSLVAAKITLSQES
jgi:hypothetical protein